MSSGKEHAVGYRVGIVMASCAAVYVVGNGAPVESGMGLFVGALVGSVIDPDLRDMHNITTRNERRMYAIPFIGPVVGFLWQVYWYPMSRLIEHRSIFSHLPVFATAIAAAYVVVPPTLIFWLFFSYDKSLVGYFSWLAVLYQPWMWMLFWGWVLQDTIHFIQDGGNIKWLKVR